MRCRGQRESGFFTIFRSSFRKRKKMSYQFFCRVFPPDCINFNRRQLQAKRPESDSLRCVVPAGLCDKGYADPRTDKRKCSGFAACVLSDMRADSCTAQYRNDFIKYAGVHLPGGNQEFSPVQRFRRNGGISRERMMILHCQKITF